MSPKPTAVLLMSCPDQRGLVARVSHRDTVEDLVRKGRDLERIVLARAVRLHLEHRVLPYGIKTVVFD